MEELLDFRSMTRNFLNGSAVTSQKKTKSTWRKGGDEPMHEEKVKEIYDSLSDNEKYGVRFGLFPYRILSAQLKHKVSAADLMQYDEAARAKTT